MTNVPQDIRERWTDLYKLFDRFFLMQNTDEDWNAFWTEAKALLKKGHGNIRLQEGIYVIADYFSDRMKAETKNGQ